ncbi:hypothetical protein [Streptomyces flaveolus]|uniref:hypothetical protein n=1 Tax=Streptomyces flaveolus TaxID=67297 RepID=UPI003422576E
MSNPRRQLGTGPSSTSPPVADTAPRLLPIERAADPGHVIERQEVTADRSGRRILGAGPPRPRSSST